jgi:hypothetical protein
LLLQLRQRREVFQCISFFSTTHSICPMVSIGKHWSARTSSGQHGLARVSTGQHANTLNHHFHAAECSRSHQSPQYYITACHNMVNISSSTAKQYIMGQHPHTVHFDTTHTLTLGPCHLHGYETRLHHRDP